jgi:hypothetical protein
MSHQWCLGDQLVSDYDSLMESTDILKRIEELLNLDTKTEIHVNSYQLAQGCVSLLTLVYGPKSAQVQQFNASLAEIPKGGFRSHWVALAAQGTLNNLKREIEDGLAGSLRSQITGEVLTDLVQLARVVLNESGDGAKNVAAVLSAAAFEDTIRRMGESLAGVMGEDDLAEVLKKLKESGVIQSPQVGIAQSYLNFRNHALHANWDKIQREAVQSVLGFVEQLLLKHFQ